MGEAAAARRSQLYDEIELATLERLLGQLRDPDCPAQVIQAAVSMLRAGGVQARGATAGLESSESRAVKDWLKTLPQDEQDRLLSLSLRVQSPRPKRGSAAVADGSSEAA